MKKNYAFLIFLLLSCSFVVAQKVTLTPTVVNGHGYSSGPINLGTTYLSSISLGVKVELPADPGDNGTINIYYARSSSSGALIASGSNGGNLFFGGGKIGLSSFIISLNSSQFDTSGGFIYAEYKTFLGITYKSSNISVIKNGTTPPPPTNNSKSETIPYAGIPLLPKLGYFAYDVVSKEWVDNNDRAINVNTPFYAPNPVKEKATLSDGRIIYSKSISFGVANFMFLNRVTINSVINGDQYLTGDQSPQIITGNEASESHYEKIEGSNRSRIVTNKINNYLWQTRIKAPHTWADFNDTYFYRYGWTDIPNATEINYTPPKTTLAMEYRRLSLESESDRNPSLHRRCATSNVISIIPIKDRYPNTICCNQTVLAGDIANNITGNSPVSPTYHQWQISQDGTNWNNINHATDDTYTPVITTPNRSASRDSFETLFYRRIIYSASDEEYYMSNTIKAIFEPSNTISEPLKIYPNPTTSILNIEMKRTIGAPGSFTDVFISNESGTIVTPKNISLINPNLYSLDVSNLTSGIYIISVLIKAEGATRSYPIRAKFIKQ